MKGSRRIARWLALGALLGVSSGAAAQAPPPELDADLAAAQTLYRTLDYEGCVARLSRERPAPSSPSLVAQVELYLGLCHFSLGAKEGARGHFEAALRLDPELSLPGRVSPKVNELFEEVRRAQHKALPPPADAPLALPAPTLTEPATPALAPSPRPGRSRTWLPVALGSLTAAVAGSGLYFGWAARSNASDADAARFSSDARRLASDAHQAARHATIAFAVAATLAAGTVGTWLWEGRGEARPASP